MSISLAQDERLQAPDTATLPRPQALLLDFGGIIVTTVKRAQGLDEAATLVTGILDRAMASVPHEDVKRSLKAGLTALTHWKHAASRRLAPTELTHREIVEDFLASDLPTSARAVLVAEASQILDALQTLISDHVMRPGITDLLNTARAHNIPVGIVSNAHSGRSHRRILAGLGLSDAFAVQIYSDEVGIRKPNPAILTLASQAVGVDPAQCWYVGDTFDRDVVAAHRAGIGTVIVTRDKHTATPPFDVALEADVIFDSPVELAVALESALADAIASPPQRAPQPAPQQTPQRGALLIDHGGVISDSTSNPQGLQELGNYLAHLLGSCPDKLTATQASELIHTAKSRRAHVKTDTLAETSPHTFWVDCFGADLSPQARAILTAEAHDLMRRYGIVKSNRSLRAGVREALEFFNSQGMPIVVVSNTLSGSAVRHYCEQHGLADLIGAYICSDEHGSRKPAASIVHEALTAANAHPAASWFYGDKPHADAKAALAAGITRRVVVRGGSTPDDALDAALDASLATDVVDDAFGLLALAKQALSTQPA